MTTGMRPEQTTVTKRKGPRVSWLWVVVAIVIASALIGWATTPKPQATNSNAVTDTTHDASSGSQGSVGGFSQQVVPGQGPNGNVTGSPMNSSNPSRATGTGSNEGSRSTGQDMGAGSSGINTATDSLGGSTPSGGRDSNSTGQTGVSVP